jgi:hypothetical protein
MRTKPLKTRHGGKCICQIPIVRGEIVRPVNLTLSGASRGNPQSGRAALRSIDKRGCMTGPPSWTSCLPFAGNGEAFPRSPIKLACADIGQQPAGDAWRQRVWQQPKNPALTFGAKDPTS